MSRKGKRKTGECAYCGEIHKVSREHVIPLCLFKRPYPPRMITVPACDDCNNKKSSDDDFLRDLITTDIYGSQSAIAQEILKGKVLRSVQRNSSELWRGFLPNAKLEPFYTKEGIYLGHFPSAPIEEERIKTVFSTIVRGLYYEARKQRIPANYEYEVRRYHPWDFKNVWDSLWTMHPNWRQPLGDVFGCVFLSAQEDSITTFWVLWFYESFFISVSVVNPDLMKRQRSA